MLEMWGYSIACAKHGVRHRLMDALQIEPSSQFGTRTRDDADQPNVYILHYTFGHQFSLEGARLNSVFQPGHGPYATWR